MRRTGIDRLAALGLAAGAFWLLPIAAQAATGGAAGPSEVVFFFQIMMLIFTGRLLGEAMQRLGQPAVTGQLIAGILLGPSFLGLLWPDAQHWLFPAQKEQKAMLDGISQVGIMMLLLLTGMETDLRLVRRAGLAALSVSIAGIVVPFVCGFALGELLPDSMLPRPELRIVTSLFLGTALSIASIKIVAMVVREMNYMRRNLGQLIVSSAIIDDSIGWIIISIIFSLAEHGSVDIPSLLRSVLGTLLFLAASFTIGRRIVFFLIRWTNDNFVSDVPVISVILLIMMGMGLVTHFIGVHSVLGAFIAGVLIGESPILTRHIDEQLRGLITAFFAPVFFAAAGLGTDLTILSDPRLLMLTVGLILIASLGKFGGAFLGGRIGGLTGNESLALALGMNARGSTEIIIATIGLSLGALSQDLFTMIVAMAVVTTMAMPPTLRWALLRLPLRPEEEERLAREAFEERGFVTNLERLLLAADESPNGKFASRLGGMLAGTRGMPITILRVGQDAQKAPAPDTAPIARSGAGKDGDGLEQAVKAAAESTRALGPAEGADEKPTPVEVLTKTEESSLDRAVAKEAKKGYDLLLVGLRETMAEPGIFSGELSRIAAGFEGPVGVVLACGKHRQRPLESRLKILVPVSGNVVSRRGAEVALALAHAGNSEIGALFVTSRPRRRSRIRRMLASEQAESAILRDMVELADNFDVQLATAARINDSPEDAILREAKRGGYNLIVMGVSRRPGDTLYFGRVAAAVMENPEVSVLFVASEAYSQEKRPTENETEEAVP